MRITKDNADYIYCSRRFGEEIQMDESHFLPSISKQLNSFKELQ